ncbi:glycoside hydrolase family 88/105 protein [Oleiharenicola lentus]|uniref:glycoside hydrolase family 88/105 protein n=1 Tax=Oleiharenicola lentus TaxID=2508720 RepID=UPI003F6674B4
MSRCFLCLLFAAAALARAQTPAAAPADVPPYIAQLRVPPAYATPYQPAKPAEVTAVLGRILTYLEVASPVRVLDRDTQQPVADLSKLPKNAGFGRGDFLITSYEWGVTYAGMIHAAEATGDARYRDYVAQRLTAIAAVAKHLRANPAPANAADVPGAQRASALRNVLTPRSLDDSGAMAAGFIKASRAGIAPDELRPWIDNYLKWISKDQMRLADGTLARNRPLHNSLWLDDLYMSVPALAQMGVLTGEANYFDDAVKQVLQFSSRMFLPEKGLYRHGWIQEMEPHPAFHWARANGWAVVAMAELLSVLPENHAGRDEVLKLFRAHVAGLAATQGKTGLWHQLLDRNDSYLETSATAMFVYSIARGINRGWLDPLAYGPMVSLGWNAVAQQVNAKGQVENVCVGTGMGFDPAFYYYRPVSVYAAHGYGPVLLAGAEMITLFKGKGADANINDASLQFAPSPSRH